MDDSDVEMLGSPVVPKIKKENEDDPEETMCCVVLGDLNETEKSNDNEELDRDPMNLLLAIREDSCDNNNEREDVVNDDTNVSKGNRDSNDQQEANNVEEERNHDESASLDDESSSDKESEYEESVSDKQSKDKNELNEKANSVEIEETNAEETARQNALAEIYSWLCPDRTNTERIFCLYCNVWVNKCTHKSHVQKHENTNLHKDRSTEWLDFVENAGPDVLRLKTNKDFDGDIVKERDNLEDKYTDYVWNLWLKKHDWIVRTKETGYKIGYCKYCRVEMNVSTSRQRKSHEESNRHRDGKKAYPRRRKTIGGDNISIDSEYSNASSDKESVKSIEEMKKTITTSSVKEIPDPTKDIYFEKSKSSSDLCRCKLCDITMFTTSFFRHSTSNLHKQNLAVLDNPVVPDKIEKPQWNTFQTLHPWLIEDPNNPMEAFCKYCEKRIVYGTSAAKRLIHEHSAPHKAAVKKCAEAEAAKAKKIEGNDEESAEQSSAEDQESAQDEEEDGGESEASDSQQQEENDSESKSENESETETESSQNKSDARPSCIKSCQRDGKYVFCRYCKIKMQNLTNTIRTHIKTQRHIYNGKVFKKRSAASKKRSKIKHAEPAASSPVSGRIDYPWLVKFKSNSDVVFCKYCRIRFSAKANRFQHQNSRTHLEAAKKYENKPTNESHEQKPVPPAVAPLKVVVKQPTVLAKPAIKNKFSQRQLKSMFDWIQFKKGMQLHYGYCTLCEKAIYIPSPKFGYKHRRGGFHMRAQNERKRQKREQEKKNETQKRNRSDSERDKHVDKDSNESENASKEPSRKRFKPCSLQTAIETAKRLTSIHLEMLTFMRSNGRNESNTIKSFAGTLSSPTPETPKTANITSSSVTADLNATLSPIVYAATQANKRDQFDLFFNSMSESIKILPPDLASEAKLKVMQVIFEMETRAQQRQSQQQQQQQQQQSSQMQTEHQNLITHEIVNGNSSEIPSPEPMIIEDTASPIPNDREMTVHPQQQRMNQQLQQQPQNMQLQHKTQQQISSYNSTPTTSTPSNSGGPSKFAIQTGNSAIQAQQRQSNNATTSTLPYQGNISNVSIQRFNATKISAVANSSNTMHANTIVHCQQRKATQPLQLQQQQQQFAQQQNIQTPNNDRNSLLRHRIVTNQLNNLVSNVNQRINVNSSPTPISIKTSSGLTIASVNSLASAATVPDNCARTSTRAPQIRTVPLSSLTKAKYENASRDEPTFHQIQLNSSTQSKIITIDGNNYQRR